MCARGAVKSGPVCVKDPQLLLVIESCFSSHEPCVDPVVQTENARRATDSSVGKALAARPCRGLAVESRRQLHSRYVGTFEWLSGKDRVRAPCLAFRPGLADENRKRQWRI